MRPNHSSGRAFGTTPKNHMKRLLLISIVASLTAMGANAQSSFAGFWKVSCEDAFGLQIEPTAAGLYSVSFCGPGGCFEPGTYRPDTRITDDPSYKVVNQITIIVKGRNGNEITYTRCTSELNPKLRY